MAPRCNIEAQEGYLELLFSSCVESAPCPQARSTLQSPPPPPPRPPPRPPAAAPERVLGLRPPLHIDQSAQTTPSEDPPPPPPPPPSSLRRAAVDGRHVYYTIKRSSAALRPVAGLPAEFENTVQSYCSSTPL
ncbi:hypothetical protein HZH66_006270 [Vespula vulgaris]|uniref:Uncharacterized protein n=1 Tax=Vespula vulgaris TaxID=7454 RepID=A0A834N8L4_VESVU|nr:hypothetical protein HZH66_006270 [Vespula vulgaris]